MVLVEGQVCYIAILALEKDREKLSSVVRAIGTRYNVIVRLALVVNHHFLPLIMLMLIRFL
jgi:hypothetical protein